MEPLLVSEMFFLFNAENIFLMPDKNHRVNLGLSAAVLMDLIIYKKLEVSVVDHVILEKILGLSSDRERDVLAYSYDKQDAVQWVLDGEYQLAVLLSPVEPEAFKAIADAGDRMPRKSTYFYPKLPAGLIFSRLV